MNNRVVRPRRPQRIEDGSDLVDHNKHGLPEPAVVIAFLDSIAAFGMQWPGRRARSVTAATVDFR